MSKIERTYQRLRARELFFRCPCCGKDLKAEQPASLRCAHGHCFDASKYGYVNFLPQQKPTVYRKELFESRRHVFEAGYYMPLADALLSVLQRYTEAVAPVLVDAGCGEGWYDRYLQTRMPQARIFAFDSMKEAVMLGARAGVNGGRAEQGKPADAVGRVQQEQEKLADIARGVQQERGKLVDIARGVQQEQGKPVDRVESVQSEQTGEELSFFVGNLANIPLRDTAADVVLNLFSPAHYKEFARVLKPHGLVIKVVPDTAYLQEIRALLYEAYPSEEKAVYESNRVAARFFSYLEAVEEMPLRYERAVTPAMAAEFLQMTPLLFHRDAARIDADRLNRLTFSFRLLVGRRRTFDCEVT